MDEYDSYDDEPFVIVEKREGGSIGPFLIGLVVGAGIALLLAPQSGEDTRREIADRVKRAKDAAAETVGDLGEAIGETIDHARDRVEEGIDSAREAVDVRRRRVSTAVEAGRAAARKAREELEYRLAESKAAYKDS